MTDRINSITIALNTDMRVDDAEKLVQALWQFKGVIAVTTHVVDSSTWAAAQQARCDLTQKLLNALQ